jgi:hypothetical protein
MPPIRFRDCAHPNICLERPGIRAHTKLVVVRYKTGNSRGEISLHVFLRLTAMDVCCGPPARISVF